MLKSIIIDNAKLRRIVSSGWFIFVAASLLGGVFFVCFYGIYIINPTHVDWLMPMGDLKQHFEGWNLFRSSAWSFPIGLIQNMAYPYGIPITYTDSIPLVAIPLKIIANILPASFQYFGMWGLLCYMLQGGFAAMIMRHWTKNIPLLLVCALVFIASPILMQRMFIHTALASQWLILAAIWATIEWRRLLAMNNFLVVWTLLLCFAFLIHPYFLPMIGLFFAISLILSHKVWIRTVTKAVIPLAISIIIFWLIGGFAVNEISSGGLGEFALNLNSLINPLGWSKFLYSMPLATVSSESLNYLGLGLLLLLPLSVYLFISNIKGVSSLRSVFAKLNIKYVLVGLSTLFMIVLAISPRIQFGTHVLADIPLPAFIEAKWSIFRASGRLFWPVYYLVVSLILASLIKFSHKIPAVFLCIFLGFFISIQMVDIYTSRQVQQKYTTFKSMSEYAYSPVLDVEEWQHYVDNRKHIVYLDTITDVDFYALVDVATRYNLTMNTGYSARTPDIKIQDYQISQRRALLINRADIKNNLYITKDVNFIKNIGEKTDYKIIGMDGYYILQ